jgi:hypothetical protein
MDSDYHGVNVGEGGQVDIFGGEGYGNVRPFGLCDGAFNSHVVYFPVVIPACRLLSKSVLEPQ